MSFEPVRRWALRCDGRVARGQCDQRWEWRDEEEDRLVVGLWTDPSMSELDRGGLRSDGWIVARDGTVHCKRCTAALLETARAEIEGLPLVWSTTPDQPDPNSAESA